MALKNKLGIESEIALAKAEEKLSKLKAKKLFENGLLNTLTAGSFNALATIHLHLFDDIYNFAGQIRTVNISKGSFKFVPITYLADANYMRGVKFCLCNIVAFLYTFCLQWAT
jgi:cell filamentation protein